MPNDPNAAALPVDSKYPGETTAQRSARIPNDANSTALPADPQHVGETNSERATRKGR